MIKKFRIPYVCITGGEPLLQWNDIYPVVLELLSLYYKVSIETNGCVPIEADHYNRSYKYVMDVKCPSSGMSHKNVYENLYNLQPHDEIKFVIADERDYKFMKRILKSYPVPANVLASPCFDGKEYSIGQELRDWILRDGLYTVRFAPQLHKLCSFR